MTTRSQIALDPELLQRAKERAASIGISLAEYIRRLIAGDLAGPRPPGDPAQVFDLGDSRGSDVARHKDEYVAGAVAGSRSKERRGA